MYGQEHPLPYKTGEREKYILGLDLIQIGWLSFGIFLAVQMAKIVPPLPGPWIVFRYIHYGIPVILSIVVSFFEEPTTKLPLYLYFFHWAIQRLRPRKLT